MTIEVIKGGLSVIVRSKDSHNFMIMSKGRHLKIVDDSGEYFTNEYGDELELTIEPDDIAPLGQALIDFASANPAPATKKITPLTKPKAVRVRR